MQQCWLGPLMRMTALASAAWTVASNWHRPMWFICRSAFPNSHRIKFIWSFSQACHPKSGPRLTIRTSWRWFPLRLYPAWSCGRALSFRIDCAHRIENVPSTIGDVEAFFCTSGPLVSHTKKADSYARSVHITWVLRVYTHSHAPKYHYII